MVDVAPGNRETWLLPSWLKVCLAKDIRSLVTMGLFSACRRRHPRSASTQTDTWPPGRRPRGSDSYDFTPDVCSDLLQHPLIQRLASTDVPQELRKAFLEEKGLFKYGAIIPFTDKGRIIHQFGRHGRKVMGGGEYEIHGACAVMLARCEAYAEANLVLNDPEVTLAMSRPIWLLLPGKDRFCWLQGALFRDDAVVEKDGIIYVGSRPLWSREVSWAYHRREDTWAPRPSWETVCRSQKVRGTRIFGVADKESFIRSAEERQLWRECDRAAVQKLCDLESQDALWAPGTVVVDTCDDVPADTLQKIYELAAAWDTYMGDLAQRSLPLLRGSAYVDLYRSIETIDEDGKRKRSASNV